MNPGTQFSSTRRPTTTGPISGNGRTRSSARDVVDAFRRAAHRPTPDSLIRSMSHLYASDRRRADEQVERALKTHLEGMPVDHPRMLDLLRLAQGHWPNIHRELEAKRREAQARPAATAIPAVEAEVILALQPPSEVFVRPVELEAPDASREDGDPAP